MVSKLAVTAIVLIIAVPILLGYGLAFEEEEYVSYETSDRINLTDRVLNSTNPILLTSTNPLNNSELLATITYPGTGVTETTIKAPAYVSTGDTYSSIPLYETVTGYYSLSSGTTNTTEGVNQGSYSAIWFNDQESYPYLMVTANQLMQLDLSNPSYVSMGNSFGPFIQSGSDSWMINVGGSDRSTGDIRIISDRFPTYTIRYVPYTDVNLDHNYTITITTAAAIKVTHTGGAVDYHPILSTPTGGIQILRSGSSLAIGDTRYTNVDHISIAAAANQVYYSYTQPAEGGGYADPSYGWTTDVAPAGTISRIYWINSQLNGSVRLLADIQQGEYVDLQPMLDQTATSWVSIRKPTATNVTVNNNNLGNYRYLCIDITGSSVTVSGIDSWPNMYTAPNIINSVTVDLSPTTELFDRVYLSGSNTINYRIDSAEILSGYFATTENATIDMGTLWPDKSFVLSLNSIGIYGDSISYAGQNFPVTDGSITVDGQRIRLLQAAFSAIYDEETETYTPTINGIELNTELPPSPIAPALGLGGEWSLTLMAYNVERIEGTRMVWQAGEFAFNGADSSFALLGLLTCGAVFVGLGMYGRRSGAKVGMLMLITGCAALIFLAMI